jgi:uncharacterized protein (DUF58 family)
MASRRYIVLLLLVVSLIGALVTGRDLFYNLLYLWLLLIVVAGLWTWTSLRAVRLARHTRTLRAQVGQLFEERLSIHNDSRLPKLWLEVRDSSDLPGHEASLVVASLDAGQERAWVVRTLCLRRGRFRLGPLALTSGDPFGLFQVSRRIAQTASVVIYPSTVDLPDFALPLGLLPGGDALRRRTHYVTANASTVRDYAPGDSFNRIHWRSTARRDRLMAKEFELDPQADVWLFLDGDRTAQAARNEPLPQFKVSDRWWEALDKLQHAAALPPSTEEYGVSVAASLAQYFIRRDRAVGLVAFGRTREVIQPDRGERQLTRLLETLAVFQAEGHVPLREALVLEGSHLPRGTTTILITPSRDMRWVIETQSLKRSGLRMVAVVIDPATFGEPGDKLPSNAHLAETLWATQIPAYRVNEGDALAVALTLGGQGAWRYSG